MDQFRTAGHKSNRLALNAKVRIVAGKLTQTDEVRSGGSYLSQHDLRIHFGLGGATKIDFVEIHWPSGTIDKIPGSDLPVDRFYYVLEGKGLVSADQVRPRPPSR